jgi:hypothetical protein
VAETLSTRISAGIKSGGLIGPPLFLCLVILLDGDQSGSAAINYACCHD